MTGESPVCLIAGGASGIGAACVEAFAAAGRPWRKQPAFLREFHPSRK